MVLINYSERENAGLNITCASRVFLLESVVHHNFEIQAIARIDRLGQTKPTEGVLHQIGHNCSMTIAFQCIATMLKTPLSGIF